MKKKTESFHCKPAGTAAPLAALNLVHLNRTDLHSHKCHKTCEHKTLNPMLGSTTFPSPTIKLRSYGRGEGASYAIVQYSPSYMQATALGTACSTQARSCLRAQQALVRVEYEHRKIVWPERIKPKTSALIPCWREVCHQILDAFCDISPLSKDDQS
jgi:hypothetical protein